MAAFMTVNNMS